MKKILLVVFISIIAVQGFAQKLTDSLAIDKRVWISQFVPAEWGRLSYGSFNMEPTEFLARLDKFKKAAYDSVANTPKADLKKKDIDIYSRSLLYNYLQNYGVDSAKEMEYFAKMRAIKENDTAAERLMEKAYESRFTKKLPEATRASLDSMVTTGWDKNDSALYVNSGAYRNFIDVQLQELIMKRAKERGNDFSGMLADKEVLIDQLFPEGYVHEQLVFENVSWVLHYGEDTALVTRLYKKYMSFARNEGNRKKLAEEYKNAYTYVANTPAPDFTYKDINGKTVTLKSLRGKYVYIDVWATWCGPCKGEIPYLTKIEEKFHGKKIHFVSLSIDKLKDKGAWEKYVKEKKLKGIQLMVDKDTDNDFITKFNINSIPRFILIDPKGYIVDANAKRPSDGKLKEQLEKLL